MKFTIGQLIYWHEEFADGIPGRDGGLGIIIDTRKYNMYGPEPVYSYKVFRNKHSDFSWFEERNITLKE